MSPLRLDKETLEYEISLPSGKFVMLRFVLRDIEFLENLLDSELTDQEFAISLLDNQISETNIGIDSLQELSEFEQKAMVKEFIEHEDDLFKEYQDTGDFYKDVKTALLIWFDSFVKTTRKTTKDLSRASTGTVRSIFNEQVKICQQILSNSQITVVEGLLRDQQRHIRNLVTPFINEISKDFSKTAVSLALNTTRLSKINEDLTNQIQESMRVFTDLRAQPIIDMAKVMSRWLDQNSESFKSLSDYATRVSKLLKIEEAELSDLLKDYRWFLTPSLPIEFVRGLQAIHNDDGFRLGRVNNHFYKFFEKDNSKNLIDMVQKWRSNPLLKKRYPILMSSAKIVRLCTSRKDINAASVLMPTLIAQIDGFITDFLIDKELKWDSDYWGRYERGKAPDPDLSKRLHLFNNEVKGVMSPDMDELFRIVILDILLGGTKGFVPKREKYYSYKRHQIMHGNKVNYGRRDHMYRTFLALDFLSYLI